MTTFVTGATSQIGHFLLPALARRGESVIALSRRHRKNGRPTEHWLTGALAEVPASPGSFDAVVSLGPLDGLADWLSRRSPVSGVRLVAISSMSADSKRASPLATEREVSQRLRDGEARLIEQCERLGISWTILRPTLIYGAGQDKSLTPIARRASRWRVFPIPGGAGLRQPVHAEDVAAATLQALYASEAVGRILPLGGGERLVVAEMFRRVRDSLPMTTLPIPVPQVLLMAGAHLDFFYRGPLLRLDTDLIADNGDACRILGIRPRGFRPTAACWGMTG